MSYKEKMDANGFWDHNRSNQRINWLHEHVRYLLREAFIKMKKLKTVLEEMPEIKSGRLSAIAKARELVDLFTDSKEKKMKSSKYKLNISRLAPIIFFCCLFHSCNSGTN
jgi:uncharacterized coiled-coil DUF342 family protein